MSPGYRKAIAGGLLTLMALGCSSAQILPGGVRQERLLAIRGVRVFDGEHVLANANVVVQGGQIVAVGQDAAIPREAEVLEGQGLTLLPGLIDAHFHSLGYLPLQTSLAFGVTTVIDLFTQQEVMAAVNEDKAAGRDSDQADLVAGMLITAPGGHGTQYGLEAALVSTAAECEAAVQAHVASGARFIKLIHDNGKEWSPNGFPALSKEVLAACIQAAHAQGRMAVVHALTLRESREAIEAGADGLAHAACDVPPDPAYAPLVASRGVFVVPTLSVLHGLGGQRNGEALAQDALLAPYLGPSHLESLRQTFAPGHGHGVRVSALNEAVRQLKAAGVHVLAGSDNGNPGTAMGASMHQELQLLVAAGLTPTEALAGATSLPAARFKLDDRGRIAPGLRADLLLVRGDPTTDIHTTRDIIAIFKRGIRLDREAFRARVRAAPVGQAAAPVHTHQVTGP